MANNINNFFDELAQCLAATKRVMKKYHIDTDGTCYLDANLKDPDELQKLKKVEDIIESLDMTCNGVLYLTRPVIAESTLHLNSRGRYEDEVMEYTCGCGIEFLRDDGFSAPRWTEGRIESDGENYYIVHHTDLELEGLKTRHREAE